MTGDIFVDGDRAVIMSDSQVRDFLLYHLKTVGRKKVEVSLCPEEVSLLLEHAFQMVRCVVASARLDALVGAAANLSRSEAQDSILGGKRQREFCADCGHVEKALRRRRDFCSPSRQIRAGEHLWRNEKGQAGCGTEKIYLTFIRPR